MHMPAQFDVAIVGTGVAASTVAGECREAGWSVAVIDSRPFGGTCENRGCEPKKVLVGAGEACDWAARMHGRGLISDSVRIDWPALMRFKRSFTDRVPKSHEDSLAKAGIAAYHGVARFTAPDAMEVNGERLEAKHFVLASGAAPASLGIPGEEFLVNSDGFLDLATLPESMIFIGGGYIAFEFAYLAHRAGARVTILHRGKRPLEAFDGTLVDQLVEHSRRKGIEIQLEAPVTAIERTPAGYRVRTPSQSCEAAIAIHAAGRPPQFDALHLTQGQVDATPRGITVNSFLQSVSNPRVYAAGDAAASGGPALTPIARYEGRIVAANLLRGNHREPDYRGVASTVFTMPPLAMVGLTEDAARRQNLEFDVHHADSSAWYTSRRLAEETSGFKVLVERSSGRVLGAHLLGEGSEEVINLFALGIRHNLTAAQMKEPLYAYPTRSSDLEYMV
jgi:glutathione reductase (NADPH)